MDCAYEKTTVLPLVFGRIYLGIQKSLIAIHGFWIPAFPAGMTRCVDAHKPKKQAGVKAFKKTQLKNCGF